MPLRAGKLDKLAAQRFKFFLWGPAGVGKTIAALQLFPKAVIIDTEKGASRYGELLEQQGSVILQTTDVDEIVSELNSLHTEDHEYLSVIIDPITAVYEAIQHKWDGIFHRQAVRKGDHLKAEMADWGFGYWGKVKKDYRRVMDLVKLLDMNVCLTAHQKDEYAPGGELKKVGVTFNTMKGADYFFDNEFRMFLSGETRMVETKKQRTWSGKKFDPTFKWDTGLVRDVWGVEGLDRKAEKVELASDDQVKRIVQLTEVLGTPDETIQKWFDKAQAETWSGFPADALGKCIKALEKKLPKAEDIKS